MTVTDERDTELGHALNELYVPLHGADFYDELQSRLSRRDRRRLALRITLVAAAVAIVAAVLAIHTDSPEVASAAVVKTKLRHALVTLRNASGVLVADGRSWRFTLDAAGDARLEGPRPGDVTVYNAATGVVYSAQHSASLGGDTLFYAERTGVAPGPPDAGPPTWILPGAFAEYVRAALAANDPAVHDVTYEGRAAWRLDVDDRFQITVDQGSGMPVRVAELKRGAALRELHIDDLRLDEPLPADTFRLSFPAGAEVMRSDDGFRRVKLADVEAAVGYAPLVPSTVPTGYRLAEIAVSRTVVSLSYRRGLDQFLVTTRPAEGSTWTDPFTPGEGLTEHGEQITLTRGPLATAHLVVAPRVTPHLWAETNELVVTVSGDLSRRELIDVAESLAPR